jgi:hypothetical protein
MDLEAFPQVNLRKQKDPAGNETLACLNQWKRKALELAEERSQLG